MGKALQQTSEKREVTTGKVGKAGQLFPPFPSYILFCIFTFQLCHMPQTF